MTETRERKKARRESRAKAIGEKIQNYMKCNELSGIEKKRLSNNFDEDFNGFHFYEIDFCFNNHLNGVKVGVMSDLRITHKSIEK